MIGKLVVKQELTVSPSRLIAIGDVHGQFGLLKDLIENRIKFDPEKDALIFLGDYIDRAPSDEDEKATLAYLVHLANAHPGRIVLLEGNHEYLAAHSLRTNNPDIRASWFRNGGGNKMYWSRDELEDLLQMCEMLPKYIETDKFVFVHAGVLRDISLANQSDHTLLWSRGEYYGYAAEGVDKKTVSGHTVVDDIVNTPRSIQIDLGAYRSGRLAAFDVLNDVEYVATKK